jgi:hypothetical protein
MIAAMSSDVATGRSMKIRDGFTAGYPVLRLVLGDVFYCPARRLFDRP